MDDTERTERNIDPADYHWATTHLTPLTDEHVERRAPWSFEAADGWEIRGAGGTERNFYECAFWDTSTGYCTAHDLRPPFCRRYPWEGEPVPNAMLPPSCAFFADLDKPIIPVRFLGRLYPGWKVNA